MSEYDCARTGVVQVRYNDMSPMENHHAAAAFSILLEDGCDFLGGQTRQVGHCMWCRAVKGQS